MSFSSAERSTFDALPIALYEFRLGTRIWRYASSDSKITIDVGEPDDVDFLPLVISDSGVVQSGDAANDDTTITLPKSSELVGFFNGTPPSETMFVNVRRANIGEPDAPIIWVGEVYNVKIVSAVAAEVICKMLTSSLDKNGLRLAWGRGCPHALYDSQCRVNKALYGVTAPIEHVSGATVEAAAFDLYNDNYFSGGFLEFQLTEGVIERRAVETHIGNGLSILGAADGMAIGTWITVYPGCDRTTAVCETKFNNLLNYGGFPHIPGKSPFDGDPVF